ncbi:MAG: hypothetical protein KBD66_04000 [Candidatus Doudnabacteria bacterium]|nr:hypothetical protein [Candidatus Doudnabacteria bacterium]
MNNILRELLERRLEILAADFLMHLALYIFTLGAMAIYIVAVVHNNVKIYELVPMLLLSLVIFVIMRGDFMIHRPAGHVRYVEGEMPKVEQVIGQSGQPIKGWETWKSERKNTWLMGVMDLAGAIVLLFILFRTQQALWQHGQYWFVIVTTTLILGAAALIPKVVAMAPR